MIKGNVRVTLSESHLKNGNARFSTKPLKALSDRV